MPRYLNGNFGGSSSATSNIVNVAVTSTALGSNTVDSSHIVDASIVAGDITDATITEAKLDSTVQTKLNSTAVSGANIADGSVTEAKLDSAVQTKLNDTVAPPVTLAGNHAFTGTNSFTTLTASGDGSSNAGKLTLNCHANSHGVAIQGPPHSAAQSYTLTLPITAPADNKVLGTNAGGQLSWSDGGGATAGVTFSASADSTSTIYTQEEPATQHEGYVNNDGVNWEAEYNGTGSNNWSPKVYTRKQNGVWSYGNPTNVSRMPFYASHLGAGQTDNGVNVFTNYATHRTVIGHSVHGLRGWYSTGDSPWSSTAYWDGAFDPTHSNYQSDPTNRPWLEIDMKSSKQISAIRFAGARSGYGGQTVGAFDVSISSYADHSSPTFLCQNMSTGFTGHHNDHGTVTNANGFNLASGMKFNMTTTGTGQYVRFYPRSLSGVVAAMRWDVYIDTPATSHSVTAGTQFNNYTLFTQPYIVYNPPSSDTTLSIAPAQTSMTTKILKLGDDTKNRPWKEVHNIYTDNCYWSIGSDAKMTLDAVGNLSLDGSLSQNSDLSLKSIIDPLTDCTNKMLLLNPTLYVNRGNGDVESGFIAQEVELIDDLKHIVGFNNPHKTVKYTHLIAYLVGAVKEMDARIKILEGNITQDVSSTTGTAGN